MSRTLLTTQAKLRPITDRERGWRLPHGYRFPQMHASGCVIRINSTYLELVDGYFKNRGTMAAIGLYAVLLFSGALLAFWYSTFTDYFLKPQWHYSADPSANAMLMAMAAITSMAFCPIVGFIAFNRRIGEWFGYTHYPIRLNRKNQTVYVFRSDGTVLSAPWNGLYFTLRTNLRAGIYNNYGIAGLVLTGPDTVLETFVFGYASERIDFCHEHWEFIRRYMEEGPQAVIDAPGLDMFPPIADKRETIYQGWIRLIANDSWNPIVKTLMYPINALFFIGRLTNRWTCKVPLWPAEVEAACGIDAQDPYVRDSGNNPYGYR